MSDDFFEELEAYAERRIEKISMEISRRFEEEMQRRLDDWAQRFPRHRFEAYQSHGMLGIGVSPPLSCDKHTKRKWTLVDNIPDSMRRGAIGELCEEVERLCTAHSRLEWKLSTYEFGPMYSREPGARVDDEPSRSPFTRM